MGHHLFVGKATTEDMLARKPTLVVVSIDVENGNEIKKRFKMYQFFLAYASTSYLAFFLVEDAKLHKHCSLHTYS